MPKMLTPARSWRTALTFGAFDFAVVLTYLTHVLLVLIALQRRCYFIVHMVVPMISRGTQLST